MSPLSEVNQILAQCGSLTSDFNNRLVKIHYDFQCAMNSFKTDIAASLNKEVADDSFLTISLLDVNNRIKIGGPKSPSKVLCASLNDLSDPSMALMPLVCTDGSLMVGNGNRAAAFSMSFGHQLPEYNYSMSSPDTSSSTSVELQAINHALQTALGLGLNRLSIFSDSTATISFASLAIMTGPHQSKDLTRLSNQSKLFKKMLQSLHNNGKKYELLCLLHVRAHEAVVCPITETNSLCDVLVKEAAKASLLSRLPANIVRPTMIEIHLPIQLSQDPATSLSY